MSLDEVRAHFRGRLDAHFRGRLDAYLAEVLAEREADGLTTFMGMAAIKAQDPRNSLGDTFPTFATNPRIACKDPELRVALLAGLVAWRGSVRAALARWKDGDRGATFPYGTYWRVRFHGVSCERAPPA